ncbi:uncharacterized protein [Littorina saxatilis]|uniref:uncharacterized protein n=1 Tax=Littorina saxatilis TaxID=31220 RepID=UPI0038B477E1
MISAPDIIQLTFGFYDANGDRPHVVSFKFNENRTNFFSWKSGTYYNQEQVTSPAFPLARLVPFSLELVASSEYAFDVYVNGALYHHRSTPANVTTSVTTIVKMRFWGEVDVHDLDLWCE